MYTIWLTNTEQKHKLFIIKVYLHVIQRIKSDCYEGKGPSTKVFVSHWKQMEKVTKNNHIWVERQFSISVPLFFCPPGGLI